MPSKRLPVFYSWLTRDSMNWVMSSFCTTSQEKIGAPKLRQLWFLSQNRKSITKKIFLLLLFFCLPNFGEHRFYKAKSATEIFLQLGIARYLLTT